MQRAHLLRLVDDEGVGLVELGVLFAVLEKEFDGAEVDGLDAETEDVVAVAVDGEGVGALSQEQVCKVPFPAEDGVHPWCDSVSVPSVEASA